MNFWGSSEAAGLKAQKLSILAPEVLRGNQYLPPMRILLLALALLGLHASCRPQLQTYVTPQPVDTETRPVLLLRDTIFATPNGVLAKADFPSARLANFEQLSPDSASGLQVYRAEIPAENEPINQSPWYAMHLSAPSEQEIIVRLQFPRGVGNRYLPKVASRLAGPWTYLPTTNFDSTGNTLDVRLNVGPTGVYLAGQEIIATDSIRRYVQNFVAARPQLRWDTIGQSRLGRSIWKLDTGSDDEDDRRPTVILFSRQHPPEITGFQAFQAFLETVFADTQAARDFRERYRIIIFPLINPDGVDEGHWRHNTGGIDLNRDWGYYRQQEVLTVVQWLQQHTRRDQVVWGMDFHSTQYDVLYTHDPLKVNFKGVELLQAWTDSLAAFVKREYAAPYQPLRTRDMYRAAIVGQDTLRIEPEAIGRPTSASWIAMHYQAVGVTYEVADEQDRVYIQQKAQAAAQYWMEILLRRAG